MRSWSAAQAPRFLSSASVLSGAVDAGCYSPNTSGIARARRDKSPKRHRRIVSGGIAIRELLSRACLRQILDQSHDRGNVHANGHFSADIGLLHEMNGFVHVPSVGFIAMSDAGQLNVPDLLRGNFETVFLIFTELQRIATQNQRARNTPARSMTVIDREFNWRGQVERLAVALGHPGGKLLHQILIGKLAEFLNDVLVIEGNQHVVPGPGAIPAASSRVVASNHP